MIFFQHAKREDLVKMEAHVPEVDLVTVVNANYLRMGNCKTILLLVVLIAKHQFVSIHKVKFPK